MSDEDLLTIVKISEQIFFVIGILFSIAPLYVLLKFKTYKDKKEKPATIMLIVASVGCATATLLRFGIPF